MISTSDLINSVTQSTTAYLGLLRRNGKGRQSHQAWNLRESSKKLVLIENESWPVVTCSLPPKTNFMTDSAAYFVSSEKPGTENLARILSYDPKTGQAELAVKTIPSGNKGVLIIDFTWLIERCLDWLKSNGAKISNPFLRPETNGTSFRADMTGAPLSEEQLEAIESLLRNRVAYVWGPPGTGKTRHVLAETVTHLICEGKKILVTASTNLAVDNALDAILSLNRTKQFEILRVGIPSSEFSKKWPDSCEDRAMKRTLREFEAEEKRIHRRLGAPARIVELQELIPNLRVLIETLRASIALSSANEDDLRLMVSELEVLVDNLRLLIAETETSLLNTQEERGALHYPEAAKSVVALEREHSELIAERQNLEDEIRRQSAWVRLFTKKPAVLRKRIETVESRLVQVELTLCNQRESLRQLAEEDARLESIAADLKQKLACAEGEAYEMWQKLEASQQSLSGLHARLGENQTKLEELLNQEHGFSGELEELTSLGLPPDAVELAQLQEQLDQLKVHKASISQDLSEKQVIGATLDGFIGLTMNQAMRFDHVVVDEAGYAPLAKVIPLLLLHCPISLLGDHKQLPPVYEGKNDSVSEAFWGRSALYLEEAFEYGIGNRPDALCATGKKDPRFENMKRSSLTCSYRFGSNLAQLLDRHFYDRIGLQSAATRGTSIHCYHCEAVETPGRQKRQNPSEASRIANKVKSWLKWSGDNEGTLAILTPYKAQVNLLRKELRQFQSHPEFHRVDVMNVHKSQGREWDTVFFSAVDGSLPGNKPYYTDSKKRVGALVSNTAVSRAKRHLRFFLDRRYWSDRGDGSLLVDVSRGDDPPGN